MIAATTLSLSVIIASVVVGADGLEPPTTRRHISA
jgi:hypothetical protein